MLRPARSRGGLPWFPILLTALMLALGLVFLRSSTAGTYRSGLPLRQLKSVILAGPVFLVAALFPLRGLARLAGLFYALTLGLLVAVFFVGVEYNQARRWIPTPLFHLQPSELAKPALVLVLARALEFRDSLERWRDLAVPALLTAIPFLLIRAEPDLGTALVLLPIAAAMLFAAGAPRRWFLAGFLGVVVLAPVAYFSPLLKDYQKERVRSYLQSVPELTAQVEEARRSGDLELARAAEDELRTLKRGPGYQAYCAQIAIGSGGITGKGLGQGPQNRLSYLPERHTDFVFAVIAEEWGMVGAGVVVFLFVLLGFSILAVASATKDRFGQLVCVGAAASLIVQALANIGVTTHLLPTTGLPLPFFSHGGSSMLCSIGLLGLVVAVGRQRHVANPFLYHSGSMSRDPFSARAAREGT